MKKNLPLLSNLTLKDLYSLQMLLDLKNISVAADTLGCAQPNLSRCFKKIRDYFQDPILVRAGKDMVLTPKAVEIKQTLEDLADILEKLAPTHFDPVTQSMEFIISAPDFVVQNVLGDVLGKVYGQFPNISFTIHAWNNNAKEMLLCGDIHLAISLDNKFPANIYRRIIDRDVLVCVTSVDHPIAKKGRLDIEDLYEYDHVLVCTGGGWVGRMRDRLESGKNLSFKFTAASYGAAFAVIEKSELISILPLHVVNHSSGTENIKVFQLPLVQKKLEYGLCWHERFHSDPAHQWLRQTLFPLILSHPKQRASESQRNSVNGE